MYRKIINRRGKTEITVCQSVPKTGVNPSPCKGDNWVIPNDELPDVSKATRNHLYILPDNTAWILNYDGDDYIQIAVGDVYTKAESDEKFATKESLESGPLIFKNTRLTNQDWNDITDSGIYYCAAATGHNMPYTGKLYGCLTVYNDVAVIIQKYEFNSSVYMQTFAGNPPSWGAWLKITAAKEETNSNEN